MTLPDAITFRDHGSDAADDDASGQPRAALQVPSRELLRTHAALGSVLYASGVVHLFDRILFRFNTGDRRDDLGDLSLPTPDGVSFWRDVVDEDEDVLDRLVRSFAAMY